MERFRRRVIELLLVLVVVVIGEEWAVWRSSEHLRMHIRSDTELKAHIYFESVFLHFKQVPSAPNPSPALVKTKQNRTHRYKI